MAELKPDDLGLQVLESKCSATDEASSATKVDIVAVHGMNGHRIRTWTCTYQDEESVKTTLWLSDLLPKRIAGARVMTFGYLSNPATGSLVNAKALRQSARELLEQLHSMREHETSRPLVFISHDLGGVLVKELLWIANNENPYLPIATNTTLLVFFGTPHHAYEENDTSTWNDLIFDIALVSTEDESFKSIRREILTAIIRATPDAMVAASTRFHRLEKQYRLLNIFETQQAPFVGMVVPEGCATIKATGEHYCKNAKRDTDHLRLCQFSKDDEFLEMLCDIIVESATAPANESLNKYLECRQTVTTLYPEISVAPISHPWPKTLEWSSRILAEPSALVFIYGQPGSGKSVLSRHLGSEARKSGAVTLEFHFDMSDHRRRTSTDLLWSFIRQLLCQIPSVFQSSSIRSRYDSIAKSRSWTSENLWGLFRSMVGSLHDNEFVCIVDGVDDCDITKVQLLRYMAKLKSQIETRCKFVITSRQTDLYAARLLSEEFNVPTIDLDNEEDMKANKKYFVEQRTRASAISDVADDLQGLESTFLILDLIITTLLDTRKSTAVAPSRIRMSLGSKQLDYGLLYEHLLLDIPPADKYWSFWALSWLVYAAHPLTVDQLAVAVVAIDDTPSEDLEWQVDKHIRPSISDDVQRVLGGVVKIEQNEVYFTHHTVRHILIGNTIKLHEKYPGFDQAEAWHAKLAASCLRCLRFEGISGDVLKSFLNIPPQLRLPNSLPPRHSFLVYAANHWATHLRQTACKDSLLELTLNFLKDTERVSWWSRVYWALKVPLSMDTTAPISTSIPTQTAPCWNSPLEISAHLGLASVVDALQQANRCSSDDQRKALILAIEEEHTTTVETLLKSEDGKFDSSLSSMALERACELGCSSVVENVLLLWEHNTEVLQLERCLCISAERGHVGIITLLIASGADVLTTTNDGSGDTPLILAARNGYEATVLNLLEENAEADTYNKEGLTALHEAAKNGHLASVQELLPKCDYEIGTREKDRAIHLAARYGHDSVVKELIDKGAEKEVTGGWWDFTPLLYAACYGHLKVVNVLLAAGAETSVQDDEGFTPLSLACANGQVEVVRALLEEDADTELPVVARDNKTALHFAAENGHPEIVRALLESRAAENPVNKQKETPLHLALESKKFNLEVVKLLLEYDADVNKRRSDSSTALHIAARRGFREAAECILNAGADLEALGKMDKSPLLVAAEAGDFEIIQLLLARGANGSQLRGADESLFSKMVETGRLEVLNLLLCQGVEVPELRHADQSLLLKMIGTGKFETLKLLLDRGVDVSQLQRADESLLLENVRTGMLETVKLLLDRGWAEPDGKRKSEALFLAIAKGSEKITQLLLEHGYDSNNYDRFGRTPWDIANRPSIRALLRPSRDALEDKGFTCSTLTRREHNLSTGWSCDICGQKLRDEFYYHCCQCSRACTKGPSVDSGYTYDMCADCATSKGCKAKGEIVHEHRRRFIGDGMLSFAELSPDDFQKFKPGVDVN